MSHKTVSREQSSEECSEDLSQKLANIKFSRLVSFDVSSHASACSHSIDYFLPNGQRVTNGNVFQKANPGKKQGSEEESPKFRLDY